MTSVSSITRFFRAGQIAGLAAVAIALAAGCTDVNGGAVELSWKLRPASSSLPDKFVSCDADPGSGRGSVTRIRLHWQVDDGEPGTAAWRCDDNHGVTGFDLPAGNALLWVTPDCATGPADEVAYIAPAPERRNVILGDTVSLGAVELVLQVSYCGQQPCICEAPVAPVTPSGT